MKILFLHGWTSLPGGKKPTFLKEHDPFLASLRSDDRFAGLMEKARQVSESITN